MATSRRGEGRPEIDFEDGKWPSSQAGQDDRRLAPRFVVPKGIDADRSRRPHLGVLRSSAQAERSSRAIAVRPTESARADEERRDQETRRFDYFSVSPGSVSRGLFSPSLRRDAEVTCDSCPINGSVGSSRGSVGSAVRGYRRSHAATGRPGWRGGHPADAPRPSGSRASPTARRARRRSVGTAPLTASARRCGAGKSTSGTALDPAPRPALETSCARNIGGAHRARGRRVGRKLAFCAPGAAARPTGARPRWGGRLRNGSLTAAGHRQW